MECQLHEHSNESFKALIDAIEALGYDRHTAGEYALLIGCCPCLDENGLVVVRDRGGRELARLKLPGYSRSPVRKAKPPKPRQPGTLYCLPSTDAAYIRQHSAEMVRRLVAPIVALGYDAETAANFARLIVKNPCQDHEGKIVVVSLEDGGPKELAHLELNLFPDRVSSNRK